MQKKQFWICLTLDVDGCSSNSTYLVFSFESSSLNRHAVGLFPAFLSAFARTLTWKKHQRVQKRNANALNKNNFRIIKLQLVFVLFKMFYIVIKYTQFNRKLITNNVDFRPEVGRKVHLLRIPDRGGDVIEQGNTEDQEWRQGGGVDVNVPRVFAAVQLWKDN